MLKNILFDFGGVLLDLDFKKSFEAFHALGFINVEQLFSQYTMSPLFEQLELGNIEPDEFYEGMRNTLGIYISNEKLRNAWNAMLLDYRTSSLDFLKKLQADYKLYLLSNTNCIHYIHFTESLQQTTSYSSLESFFTKAYFSHEIHKRKPYEATYAFVLEDAGINAAETLFIDDTHTNLPNAEKLGIQTHLLLPKERIEQLHYFQQKKDSGPEK